jgi:hypothetical protein
MNPSYMATPYKGVKRRPRDAYNFYHSQLRVKIECAFGMLVNKFAILCQALPASISLQKLTAMTMAFCRIHNFCIKKRIGEAPSLARDSVEVESNGGIPMVCRPVNDNPPECLRPGEEHYDSPEQLLHGREHFDDVTAIHRQHMTCHARLALRLGNKLPQEKLCCEEVERQRLERHSKSVEIQWPILRILTKTFL